MVSLSSLCYNNTSLVQITVSSDASTGGKAREVVGPELVFCSDHNLLIYISSPSLLPCQVRCKGN